MLFGSASTINSSTMGLIYPGAGIIISSSTALLTSIAILITNKYISERKLKQSKLRDWINVSTLLYEETLKLLWLIKKNYEKEALELKKISNHYLIREKIL